MKNTPKYYAAKDLDELLNMFYDDLRKAETQNLIKYVYRRLYNHVTSDLTPTPFTTHSLYIEHYAHTPIHTQNKLEQFFQDKGFKTRNYDEQHTLRIWVE